MRNKIFFLLNSREINSMPMEDSFLTPLSMVVAMEDEVVVVVVPIMSHQSSLAVSAS